MELPIGEILVIGRGDGVKSRKNPSVQSAALLDGYVLRLWVKTVQSGVVRMEFVDVPRGEEHFGVGLPHTVRVEFHGVPRSTGRDHVPASGVRSFPVEMVPGVDDVASRFGVAKTDEDTGQTLGTYGISSGPYLVLPLFGPSSVRDGLGRIVDLFADPLNNIADSKETRVVANALKVVDTRARVLSAEQAFEALAFDRYVAMRSAYFAIREAQIED